VSKKTKLVYEVFTGNTCGYGQTYINIRTGTWETVRSEIEKRKEPGWGSPDYFLRLYGEGHRKFFVPGYSCLSVCLRYQHYVCPQSGDESYCSHNIEELSGLDELVWATKFLVKLSRNVAKSKDRYYGPKESYMRYLDPVQYVLDGLDNLGVTYVSRVHNELVTIPRTYGVRGTQLKAANQ